MTDPFEKAAEDFKAEMENKDTLSGKPGEMWSDGDLCGENGCKRTVHETHNGRDPQLGTRRHEDSAKYEYVCADHGIVARQR
jgi:hypothetical protein